MPSREQRNTSPVRTISDFKSKLTGGGARPNLFEVELAFPNAVEMNDVLEKAKIPRKGSSTACLYDCFCGYSFQRSYSESCW